MNSLLPPNATSQERSIEAAITRASEVPVPLREVWNPATCNVDLLPWMAWALSVDTWDANWPEALKRSVVASAIDIARHKGTVKSVKDALASLGAGSVIVEWWQKSPAGTPHTFTVNIVSSDTSAAMQDAMASEINRTKPLRSHYDIVFGTATEAALNVVGVLRAAVFVRLDGTSTF